MLTPHETIMDRCESVRLTRHYVCTASNDELTREKTSLSSHHESQLVCFSLVVLRYSTTRVKPIHTDGNSGSVDTHHAKTGIVTLKNESLYLGDEGKGIGKGAEGNCFACATVRSISSKRSDDMFSGHLKRPHDPLSKKFVGEQHVAKEAAY